MVAAEIGIAAEIAADVKTVVAVILTGAAAKGAKAIPTLEKLLARQFVNLCARQHVTECRRELRNRIADAVDHFLTHHIRF